LFGTESKSGLPSGRAGADEGDPEVQFGLGVQFANSPGNALDYACAAQWYRKAADQNHSLAQFNLGMMYSQGQGVPLDDAQALVWIRKAADRGDAGAQHNLGTRCYRASISGPRENAPESRIEASKWFQLAAAQGYLGSDAACERVTLSLSRDEVAEAGRRTTRFQAGSTEPSRAS